MSYNSILQRQFVQKQIQILSSCNEGLLTSLILESGNNDEPLFYIDNEMRLILPNDINSHIRMSYIALLKICFEKNYEMSEPILNRLKYEICRDDIRLDVYPVELIDCRYAGYYQNNVFKKILLEFFVMLKLNTRSVLDYIGRYPILDTILLTTFKTLIWHRKPNRLIETQILSVDTLLAYFRQVLGIRLVNTNDHISFQDFGIKIGFQGWCLSLYDQDARRFTFTEQSRVRQLDDSFKNTWNNNTQNESIQSHKSTYPNTNIQKVLTNSWTIPQQSIYQRLQSDCMFTDQTPDQSRQNQQINDLIHSFKRTLTHNTQSLKHSKQNRSVNHSHSIQRPSYFPFHDTSNKHSFVKMTESFQQVLGNRSFNDKIRIQND